MGRDTFGNGGLTLAKRTPNLLPKRLEQVLQRRALVGLDESFGRHSRDQANVLEAHHLIRRKPDADRDLDPVDWSEGRTISIEYRWGEGRPERFAEIAAEFVRLKPPT